MRTFGPQHFSTAILATALAVASTAAPLGAQQQPSSDVAPTARFIPARCTDAACGGDFQLAIVAALYPYDDGVTRGPSVLTLVIENRGRAAAPLAALEVAPVTPLASFAVARRAPVAALLPGERTVVEIPLTLDANGGAPCLSITVLPGFAPTTTPMQFYASASTSSPASASHNGVASEPSGGSPAIYPSLDPPPFFSIVDAGL